MRIESKLSYSMMSSFSVSYDPEKDPASNQLGSYSQKHRNQSVEYITTNSGRKVGDFNNVLTIGPRGPMLLDDVTYFDEMTHFNRERIPERVVHAKGAGAFGYFEVTNTEIQKYCRAKIFSSIGKKTDVAVRFSTVIRERGSADTVRDVRGFAVRFYTEEGNWDLVGNNTPIFFVRDPMMFMRFIHSQKRNPQTNLIDYNARWDFFTLRPETLHQVTWMFSDRGIPNGFRHMDGWGSHTYKLINEKNQPFYNKFYWRSEQGVENLSNEKANELIVTDPDYGVHDLFDAIAHKNFPRWRLFVQIMTYQQASEWYFNPFDLTKIWPLEEFPLIEVGLMTLNRNPSNYFAEVEQLAFSPSNRINGIDFSPDKVLQSRVFAYMDTQRHRIGTNIHLIPVNQSRTPLITPTQRDGSMMIGDNYGSRPNYFPNSFDNVRDDPAGNNERRTRLTTTDVYRYESSDTEDNYKQVRNLYESFSVDERKRLHENLASELRFCYKFIQERALKEFEKIHPNYSVGVQLALSNAN
ncbi:tryptophan 5-hydroxylase 1-like [Sarcoptes scabiei]|nr:tryptophan 5-hydroxylase 1-like [Sarcoptes scabiei]